MQLDRTNTASISDNDLLDVAIGQSFVHPKDLAEHIQFLRNARANELIEAADDLAKEVDEADDARIDAGHDLAKALTALDKLAKIASGTSLELVLEIQRHLHNADERLDSTRVNIPRVLKDRM